jgi:hypothetical protein
MATTEQITAGLIVALVVTAIVVGAVVYYALKIHGSGQILAIGLEAYADAGLTQKVDAITWGVISPGGYAQATIYLRSNSTGPSTWTLSTQNWQPPNAENYMILSWNYDGSVVQPGESRAVTLTLAVAPEITGVTSFEFDTVITASG